jgi:hypothetical protein
VHLPAFVDILSSFHPPLCISPTTPRGLDITFYSQYLPGVL